MNQWTDIVTYKDYIKGIDYPLSSGVPITWNIQDWYIGYNITVSVSQGGSVSPSGSVSVIPGNPQTFTITPNTGYKIKDVKVDGVSVGAVSSYTFENITKDHTIEAIFEPITFTITSSSSSGGTITPSSTITVNYGDSKTFNITPNPGYKIKDVLVDGKSVGAVSSYTFSNITSNHTIEVTFEKQITQTIITLQIGNTSFTVNGEQRYLDSPPVIKNGRTLLPIRAIIEALGGTVKWIADTKTVVIELGNNSIMLQIGNANALVNGNNKLIDPQNLKVVPEIINGRTMLPLRFVAESLGADVHWDGTTRTITITYQGGQ
ncbi:copper amine oxidase N-terminal domain-containing protein [Caldisericum exile]|uniref:copper amine oxidase N-terminal domain-containing protein n=1 Tax=Caldisericum exile TaxID=693075 RepID=UPI003C727C3B